MESLNQQLLQSLRDFTVTIKSGLNNPFVKGLVKHQLKEFINNDIDPNKAFDAAASMIDRMNLKPYESVILKELLREAIVEKDLLRKVQKTGRDLNTVADKALEVYSKSNEIAAIIKKTAKYTKIARKIKQAFINLSVLLALIGIGISVLNKYFQMSKATIKKIFLASIASLILAIATNVVIAIYISRQSIKLAKRTGELAQTIDELRPTLNAIIQSIKVVIVDFIEKVKYLALRLKETLIEFISKVKSEVTKKASTIKSKANEAINKIKSRKQEF